MPLITVKILFDSLSIFWYIYIEISFSERGMAQSWYLNFCACRWLEGHRSEILRIFWEYNGTYCLMNVSRHCGRETRITANGGK